MFHFTGCRDVPAMYSQKRERLLLRSGYPIRKSTGQSVFAALRSLSQLTASFIAYWHQGIHDALFVALSICFGLATEDSLITETLWLEILTPSRLFQTQLLKLYFLTTLYVDVKEPALTHIQATKNSTSPPVIFLPPWRD